MEDRGGILARRIDSFSEGDQRGRRVLVTDLAEDKCKSFRGLVIDRQSRQGLVECGGGLRSERHERLNLGLVTQLRQTIGRPRAHAESVRAKPAVPVVPYEVVPSIFPLEHPVENGRRVRYAGNTGGTVRSGLADNDQRCADRTCDADAAKPSVAIRRVRHNAPPDVLGGHARPGSMMPPSSQRHVAQKKRPASYCGPELRGNGGQRNHSSSLSSFPTPAVRNRF